MAARLTTLLPRFAALVVIWLLAAASYTLAAGGGGGGQPATAPAAAREKPDPLVVPDVRGRVYVFAKGILQDAGFAWRVDGSVEGFAANRVAVQTPAPGVRVVDNGAPTVVLRLERNPDYEERGLPENAAPYKGTSVVLLKDRQAAKKPAKSEPKSEAPAKPKEKKPAAGKPKKKPERAKWREPDFVVSGAPREPADELPLPRRAHRLERRMASAAKPTRRLVNHWLYQHSWIVTGARFGWKDGDQALRILIGVDRSLEERFGFGGRSERVARTALAYVESRTR